MKEPSTKTKRIMKIIVNFLSLLRIAIGVSLFTVANSFGLIATGIAVGLGMLTDLADGYLARKFNVQTNIGRLIDPIGDKFIIVISLILIIMNMESTFMQILATIPVVMECTVVTQQIINLRKNIVLNPTFVGKKKEGFVVAFLLLTLVELGISNNEILENIFKFSAGSFFLLSVGFETATIKSYHDQASEQLEEQYSLEDDLKEIISQKDDLKSRKKELLKARKKELIAERKARKEELKSLPLTTNERLDSHIARKDGLSKFSKIWAHGFTDTEFFKDNADIPVLSLIKQVSKLSIGKDNI